jgi:hypothetical protein
MRRSLAAVALLIGTTVSADQAWSEAIVRTSANSGIESSSVNTSEIPGLANEPHVSAVSHASENLANSTAAAGHLSTCFTSVGPHCAIAVPDRFVNTFASANGNNGTLKAGVHTYIDNSLGGGNTQGIATAALVDTITLTSPVIKVSIDITSFMTNNTGGDVDLQFRFGFADPIPHPEIGHATPLFTLEASRRETGPELEQGFIAFLLGEPEN